MDIERTEIRPQMKLGLILIGIGAINGLAETSMQLAAEWGGTPAVWANKALCAALIGYGVWIVRKKIIVDNGAASFVGLTKGRRTAEVMIADIEKVAYDKAGKFWAIRAKAGILKVSLAEKSKTSIGFIQALKDRGVNVA